jgi:hypothetical protein
MAFVVETLLNGSDHGNGREARKKKWLIFSEPSVSSASVQHLVEIGFSSQHLNDDVLSSSKLIPVLN